MSSIIKVDTIKDTSDNTLLTSSSGNVSISNDLVVDTNTLYVDSTNNRVGIGSSTTSYGNLTVQKASSTTDGPVLTLWNSNANAGNTCGYLRFFSNTSVRAELSSVIDSGAPFAGNFVFKTGEGTLTERCRIDSSGNLFIGISSSAGNRFAVSDDGVRSRLYVTTGGDVGSYNLGTGTVTCSSGIIGFSSDERLKIADGVLSDGLNRVMQIVPQYFYWKDKDGNKDQNRPRELGFFAQNIQATCGKEVVADPHREDVFLGIQDRGVMAILVKAIQEQQEQINELKAEVAALKGAN